MNKELKIVTMTCDECGTAFEGEIEKGLADLSRELSVPLKGACPDCKQTLYCVMIPTHRNPTRRWFDFEGWRKFSRSHDEAIKKSVEIFFGGYTEILPAEGGWMPRPGVSQREGMRPFLFTAKSEWSAGLIADVVCHHYGQDVVMLSVWSKDVQFRPKREGLKDDYTRMLYPNRTSLFKTVLDRLRKAMPPARVHLNARSNGPAKAWGKE